MWENPLATVCRGGYDPEKVHNPVTEVPCESRFVVATSK